MKHEAYPDVSLIITSVTVKKSVAESIEELDLIGITYNRIQGTFRVMKKREIVNGVELDIVEVLSMNPLCKGGEA